MKIEKISNINELRTERARLQREVAAAKSLLQGQLPHALESGKQAITNSWNSKLVLSAVGALLLKKITNTTVLSDSKFSNSTTSSSFMQGITQGFDAWNKPGMNKLLALMPLVQRLWAWYQDRQYRTVN